MSGYSSIRANTGYYFTFSAKWNHADTYWSLNLMYTDMYRPCWQYILIFCPTKTGSNTEVFEIFTIIDPCNARTLCLYLSNICENYIYYMMFLNITEDPLQKVVAKVNNYFFQGVRKLIIELNVWFKNPLRIQTYFDCKELIVLREVTRQTFNWSIFWNGWLYSFNC